MIYIVYNSIAFLFDCALLGLNLARGNGVMVAIMAAITIGQFVFLNAAFARWERERKST